MLIIFRNMFFLGDSCQSSQLTLHARGLPKPYAGAVCAVVPGIVPYILACPLGRGGWNTAESYPRKCSNEKTRYTNSTLIATLHVLSSHLFLESLGEHTPLCTANSFRRIHIRPCTIGRRTIHNRHKKVMHSLSALRLGLVLPTGHLLATMIFAGSPISQVNSTH
jgi:hypothetical protein